MTTSSIRFLALIGTLLAFFVQAPSAHAQATRTWVSGVGDDANPCSRTAPCKTFAGAISKTAAGGEIDVLDPGGFGGLTITKAITLDGGGGQVGSILVAGTNGITVAAGVNDIITLRNLRINGIIGAASGSLDGVKFNSGAVLVVENCDIFGFGSNAINVTTAGNSKLTITNTALFNNTGGGLQVKPTGGTLLAAVSGVQANHNGFGIGLDTTVGGTISMEVDRSTASANATYGLQASGANAGVQINQSTFSTNVNGVSLLNSASVGTFLNNIITQNTTNNVVGGTLTTKPLQ
jgi:hypothetical protein